MRVIDITHTGINPAKAEKATHPTRGEYWRFEWGSTGRGRRLCFIPLGSRDFPGDGAAPGPEQEYRLLPVSGGKAHILVPGRPDGQYLAFLWTSPGFRGWSTYSFSGQATLLAEGYVAQGDAGRMGGGPVPAFVVSGPCELRWERTGRLYGSAPKWRAVFDGEKWSVMEDSLEMNAVEEAFAY